MVNLRALQLERVATGLSRLKGVIVFAFTICKTYGIFSIPSIVIPLHCYASLFAGRGWRDRGMHGQVRQYRALKEQGCMARLLRAALYI